MTRESRRFPDSVYGHGTEPDPRFTLANERTFLAWIRTSLALLAAGVALAALELPVSPRLGLAASIVFLLLGAATPVQAWVGWMRVERALRAGQPLPSVHVAGPIALGVLIAGLTLLVGMLTS